MGVVCGVQGMPLGPSHLTGTYLHPVVWVKPQSPSRGTPHTQPIPHRAAPGSPAWGVGPFLIHDTAGPPQGSPI